jgi:hypothetical protein
MEIMTDLWMDKSYTSVYVCMTVTKVTAARFSSKVEISKHRMHIEIWPGCGARKYKQVFVTVLS